MLESYLVVAPEHNLAEELHREVGKDFRLIPLHSVAEPGDAPRNRVAAVVIRMPAEVSEATEPAAVSSGQRTSTLEAQVDELERRIIEDTLARNQQRRKETALVLGISRVTLYNKMKKFGLL